MLIFPFCDNYWYLPGLPFTDKYIWAY